MNILESVKEIFEEFDSVEFVQLEFESETFNKLMKFRNDVVDNVIGEDEISLIIKYLKKKDKTDVYDFVISNLFLNIGFLRNEKVKDAFGDDVYDFILEEIEEYDLTGNKSKIIDLFYEGDFDKIETFIEELAPVDKKHILKYIIEHISEPKALDTTTDLGKFISKYRVEIGNLYTDEDLFDLGEEIEFIP